MPVAVDSYFQFQLTGSVTFWSNTFGDPGLWMIVVHMASSGTLADMGGDPGAGFGWPSGSFQLLAQADAGPDLPKVRVWAVLFNDNVPRTFVIGSGTAGIDHHQHVYFLTGLRSGTDASDVLSVGAAISASGATSQTAPLYGVDGTEFLIGAWLVASLGNYTSLGGPPMRTEVDSTASTSRAGEMTLSAAGPGSLTATASVSAPWAATTVAVRQPAVGSVTFPQVPLRMKTELALGANPGQDPALWAGLWTDISHDTQPRDGGVAIKRGRADETSTVGPSSMTGLTLDNSAGRYVRLNPNGPYYGQLNKNTPIQNWIDVGDGWRLRYRGFVSEFPPKSRGGQVDENMPIEAAGITRRLARGRVLNSALRKAIASRGDAAGYWPLETGTASGILGGIDMRPRGAVSFSPDGPPGSAGAMTAPFGASTYSSITGMQDTGSWQVSFWLESPEGSADITPVAYWATPNSVNARWLVYGGVQSPVGVMAIEVHENNTTGASLITGTTDIRGLGPILVTLRAADSGANVAVSLFINGVLDTSSTLTGDSTSAIVTVGVNSINFSTAFTLTGQISHMYASSVDPSLSNTSFASSLGWLLDAAAGHPGERATDRIRRISSEANIPVAIVGDGGRSEPMGPQPVARFLDVLRDCEAADGGVLFERRDGRLAYQARAGRYNAAPTLTLDYAAGHVAPPLEPTDDDQHLRNDFTASRPDGGSSARVLDQAHIDAVGEYADSGTVNVADDVQLPHQAGWAVHLGTADDLRYPAITPNLNGRPVLIPDWAAADIGSAAAITNPGRDLPPGQVDVFVEGYTETIDTVSWVATPNCSPGKPWKVIALGDPDLGRIDTAGSALNSSAATSATSLSVKTLSGPLWTTEPADLPLDLVFGGEVVRVLDPANRITDTFTRSTSSSWGTADTGQSWATSGGTAANYSATGSTGRVSCTDVTTRRFTSIGSAITDATVAVSITVPVTALTDTITGGIVMRYTDDNNTYLAQVSFNPSGTVTLEIFKRVTGTFTSLGSLVDVITYSPATAIRLRASCVGTTFKARVWPAAQTEPGGWHVTAIDATYTSGKVGTKTSLGAGNTNTLPVAVDYDDLDMLTPAISGTSSPQTFKVVRSINGVVKAHAANEPVALALPPILAQ